MNKTSELDDLFQLCLTSELPNQEKFDKQFNETFSYNAPKNNQRRNTISGGATVRKFSFPNSPKTAKKTRKRRGTVLEDTITDFNSRIMRKQSLNSKIPFAHLIREALESSDVPLKFAEIIRWMFANMTDLDTEDINEMYKWQKGIKRVLETDPRFIRDEKNRWSLRKENDDVGYHSRNNSLQSTMEEELPTFKKRKLIEIMSDETPAPNRTLPVSFMTSIKRYSRIYGDRSETDILKETAPTVASLLMTKPNPPAKTVNDLVPLVTSQPQFSLDQLTMDFLSDHSRQSQTIQPATFNQTTNHDEPQISETNDIIAEFLSEPFLKPSNGDKYLPIE